MILEIIVSAWLSVPKAYAQTPESTEEDSTEEVVKKPIKKKTRGKYVREREAEGTEARDRFQAETVIKSKYNLNGESLEVDPD